MSWRGENWILLWKTLAILVPCCRRSFTKAHLANVELHYKIFLLWNQNRTNVISELCALINTGVQKLLVLFKVELVLKDKLRAQVWNPRSAFAELPNWCVSNQSENNWSSDVQVNPGLGNNAAAAAANRTFCNINWQTPMVNEWLNKRLRRYFCFYFPLVLFWSRIGLKTLCLLRSIPFYQQH